MSSSIEPTRTVSTTISSSSSVMHRMHTWNISPRSWRRLPPAAAWMSLCLLLVLQFSSSTRQFTRSFSDQVQEARLWDAHRVEQSFLSVCFFSFSRQTCRINRSPSPGAFQEAGSVSRSFQLHPLSRNSDLQPPNGLQRPAAQPGAAAGQQHYSLATRCLRHLQGSSGKDAWLQADVFTR